MRREELIARARRDEARREWLRAMKFSPHFKDFIRYFFARNLLPIGAMVLKRAMVLIEVALLLHFVGRFNTGNIVMVLFAFWLLRGAFEGISQHYRVAIAFAAQSGARNELQSLALHAHRIAWIFGMGSGVLAWGFFSWFSISGPFAAILLCWSLTFPLELAAHTLWSILYTHRRLRRSVPIQLAALALPSISILSLHALLGGYSYPLGVFAARTMLYGYLLIIARRKLIQENLIPPRLFEGVVSLRVLGRSLVELASSRQIHFAAPYLIYQGSVAVLIGAVSRELWIIHFFFTHLCAMVAYPALRVPLSLKTDLYFALKDGNPRLAARFRKHVLMGLGGTIVAIATTLLVFAPQLSGTLFSAHPTWAVKLFPYLLLVVGTRSIFESGFVLTQAAVLETRISRLIVTGLLLLGISAQFILIQEYRGNLQAIYLLESLLLLSAGAVIHLTMRLEKSPLLSKSANDSPIERNFARWAERIQAEAGARGAFQLVFLQVDDRYRSPGFACGLFRRIESDFARSTCFLALGRGAYLCATVDTRSLAAFLRGRYTPHLRLVVSIEVQEGLNNAVATIRSELRARGCRSSVSGYLSDGWAYPIPDIMKGGSVIDLPRLLDTFNLAFESRNILFEELAIFDGIHIRSSLGKPSRAIEQALTEGFNAACRGAVLTFVESDHYVVPLADGSVLAARPRRGSRVDLQSVAAMFARVQVQHFVARLSAFRLVRKETGIYETEELLPEIVIGEQNERGSEIRQVSKQTQKDPNLNDWREEGRE